MMVASVVDEFFIFPIINSSQYLSKYGLLAIFVVYK